MRYGYWATIKSLIVKQRTAWLCQCRCGTRRIILENNLKRRVSTSCGCRKLEILRDRKIHGAASARQAGSKAASVWLDMHKRCRSKMGISFKNYASRGIRVCSRWSGSNGFKRFLQDMGEPPIGMMIERKNNNGNYTPKNCRWANRIDQNNNKRINIHGYLNGERLTAAQISRIVGKDKSVVARQIHAGKFQKTL